MGKNEARAHHYVPQCWLAGFTDTGDTDGMLYVTDLKRRNQWRCKPSEAGHRRDFYRVKDGSVADPLAVEKLFAEIEDKIAPLFRVLTKERRGFKDGFELGKLLEYMAIQWIRVPTFRAIVGRAVVSHFSKDALITPEAWQNAKLGAGISDDAPGTEYTKWKEALDTGEMIVFRETAFYTKKGADVVQEVYNCLKRYKWSCLISEPGQFIAFDSPVAIDGVKGQTVGFDNARTVVYPVNRYVLLYGTPEAVERPFVTTKLVACFNTFAMRSADEQVFSHRSDFHWLDSVNKCQNDWLVFSREAFE